MPLQATSGAASYDAFGGGVPVVPNYIEDVFSCFLYTGTGSSQTITNNIDLSTKGGLTWIKGRSGATGHRLTDTARGVTKSLASETTAAEATETTGLTAFGTTGFTIGADADYNTSAATYVSWTFRKQPKFFDVVTYTGDGTNGRAISHSLDSTPGFIIVKSTSDAAQWVCWSRGFNSGNGYGYLNDTTDWFTSGEDVWGNGTSYIAPTSTTFTVKGGSLSNLNGRTYVAYIYAHNAGGFGLTGTDNVISCGSFTGSASGTTVNLGWEPQWVLIKRSSGNTDNWRIYDNMRGMTASNGGQLLYADTSGSETTNSRISVNATGFGFVDDAAYGNIYIAIRRGPMKVPTSGTSVFAPSTAAGEPSSSPLFTAGFSDMTLHSPRVSESGNGHLITDRLRGNGVILETPYTSAENTSSTYFKYDSNNGAYIPNLGYFNNTGGTSKPYALRAFKRAPSFFDVCCYTGTGTPRTITHNLTVAPQLMIIKRRSAASFNGWPVYVPTSTAPRTNVCLLNTTASAADSSYFNLTAPTSTVFSVDDHQDVNASGNTYVAYLFATCAGVSKVGSYTGTGTTLQVNCGFTSGARFVLIKRTDSTGDWYVWDSARGIVAGNDPYLLLNTTDAEVTNTDYIDTYSAGFEISSTAPSAINASGGTFIFLAIA